MKPISHFLLPDVQVKPNQDYDFLRWAGRYAADHKPDVIVCIGDFADMPSLSSYDVGTKAFEGRKYIDDIAATKEAMATFLKPIKDETAKLAKNRKKKWEPRLVLTLGNHENRINRAVNLDRKLEGLISIDDLEYEKFGWEVIPFLQPIIIDGVSYAHYFCTGVRGNPVSSARALVAKKHMSCVMGHVQDVQISMEHRRGDGIPLIGLFCGIYYEHDEEYLNAQTNMQHRCVWMNREVKDGFFYPHPISLDYLRRTYKDESKQAIRRAQEALDEV